MELYGRTKIYSDIHDIDESNILSVVNKSLNIHSKNRTQIQYLYDYYRGKQEILNKTKRFCHDVNNKIVQNVANEIVSFKVGYFMGDSVMFVNKPGNDDFTDAINRLNEDCSLANKLPKDKRLMTWAFICGLGYRLTLPNMEAELDEESPFDIYVLDPRNTFMVYYNDFKEDRVLGVTYVEKEDNVCEYTCYTKDRVYVLTGSSTSADTIVEITPHICGDIPITEYIINDARLGSFETVMSELDLLNALLSDRIDAIDNFVEALLVVKGASAEEDGTFRQIKELGGITLPEGADIKYLTNELNQEQSQILADYVYQSILNQCGLPNRNGESSTSDTGAAVMLRDGFFMADLRSKDYEALYKESEKLFLKLAINYFNVYNGKKRLKETLTLSAIEIKMSRRNYENILEKSQTLTTMLSNPKIHPRLAFESCNMFPDPEVAYSISKDYYEEEQDKAVERLNEYESL